MCFLCIYIKIVCDCRMSGSDTRQLAAGTLFEAWLTLKKKEGVEGQSRGKTNSARAPSANNNASRQRINNLSHPYPRAKVQILHPARTQTQRAYTFGLEMEFDDLKVDHEVNESINEDSFQEKKEYTG
jgi:hypothetical protein